MWDSGNPEMEHYTSLSVRVRRNLFVPTFNKTIYTAQVSEHDTVGTQVITVSASDNDIQVTGALGLICVIYKINFIYCFPYITKLYYLAITTSRKGFVTSI